MPTLQLENNTPHLKLNYDVRTDLNQSYTLNDIQDKRCSWRSKLQSVYVALFDSALKSTFGNSFGAVLNEAAYECSTIAHHTLQNQCLNEFWLRTAHIIEHHHAFITAIKNGRVTDDSWLQCQNSYNHHHVADHAVVVYDQEYTATGTRLLLIINNGQRLKMPIDPQTTCLGKGSMLWAQRQR